MRFLDQFSVLFLDMNGTFMFGHDRFGPDEDYFATYQALGGHRLQRDGLRPIMQQAYHALERAYWAPEQCDNFPSVAEAFGECEGLDAEEISVLEHLFAAHEIGHVPQIHRDFLREAAKSHHLGIVSNIWAPPECWLAYLDEIDLLPLF